MAMKKFPFVVVKEEDPQNIQEEQMEQMELDQSKPITNFNQTFSRDVKDIKVNLNQNENYNYCIKQEEEDSYEKESFMRFEVFSGSNIKFEENQDLDASFANRRDLVKIENTDLSEQDDTIQEEEASCNPRVFNHSSKPGRYNIVNKKYSRLINSDNSDSLEKKIWKTGEKETFVATAKKIQLADKSSLFSLTLPDLRLICLRFGWIVTGDRMKILQRILRKCRAIIVKPEAPKCRRSNVGAKYKYTSKSTLSFNESNQQNPSTSFESLESNPEIGSETIDSFNDIEESYIKPQWTTKTERKQFVESCGKSDLLEIWNLRPPMLWSLRMTELKEICKRFGWGTNGIKEKLIHRIVRRCSQDCGGSTDQDNSNSAYFVEPGISAVSTEINEHTQIDENEEESESLTPNHLSGSQEDPLCMVYSAEHVVKNGKLTVGRSLFPS